ncbi:group II intron maturase-specific domain-containing protein [Pseudomonas sp. WHRI 8519]|uniref:group II intron maturase-specific domain-containing protein n=1 Tax=Pseudomonas sp. WHRI 8519 TaxID=3162567 RepID=UPI003555DC2A
MARALEVQPPGLRNGLASAAEGADGDDESGSPARTAHGVAEQSSGPQEENTIGRIDPVPRGWAGNFKFSQITRPLEELDGWIRHKLRCAIWRQWKQPSIRARTHCG